MSTQAPVDRSVQGGCTGENGRTVPAHPAELPGILDVEHRNLLAMYALFEQAGFTYIRSKGIHPCVMRKTVPATRATSTRKRAKR